MIYSAEVQNMCSVAKGAYHGPAPIPEEGKWVQAKEIKDISGFTHGIGWCAPQQGACKLTLNVKDGIIEEALVETSNRFWSEWQTVFAYMEAARKSGTEYTDIPRRSAASHGYAAERCAERPEIHAAIL